MHTFAGSTFHNPVTLTFDLMISGSTHAEFLSQSRPMCVLSFVLIAQVFLSFTAGTQREKVTDAIITLPCMHWLYCRCG